MAYKSIEKKRANSRAYYAKHKDEPQTREKRLAYGRVYNATHKHVRAAYRATHKQESIAYREKNKEKIKKKA